MLATSPSSFHPSQLDFLRIYRRVIKENDINELQNLLQFPHFMQAVMQVKIDDHPNYTLIHYATIKGWNQVLSLILASYPEMIDQRDSLSRTPLYLAAALGNEYLVEYFLSQGADINAIVPPFADSVDYSTPLFCAIKKGHYRVSAKLIQKRAQIQYEKKSWFSATYLIDLFHIVVSKGWMDIAKTFLTVNALLVNCIDQSGKRPLVKAAAKGHLKMVDYLLINGAHQTINQPIVGTGEDPGKMAHHYAIEMGHVEITTLLIKNKANLKATFGDDCLSAIHLAAMHGHLQILKIILEVDPNLIEYGDAFNRTPLLLATIYQHIEVVKHLLSIGANIEEKINHPENKKIHGLRALEYAKKHHFDEIAALLIDAEKEAILKKINTKKSESQHIKSLLFFQEVTPSFYIKSLPKLPNKLDINHLNENGHLLSDAELKKMEQLFAEKNINLTTLKADKLKEDSKYDKNSYKVIKFAPGCFSPIYHGQRHGIDDVGLTLGTGAFATVKLGQLPNSEFIACKKIRMHAGINKAINAEKVSLEYEILSKMNYAVGHYDRPGLSKDYFIAMKLAPGKDLIENCNLELPDWRWLKFVEDLFLAIKKLHSKGFIHCDIKLENIMFDEFGEVNLIDFGLALKFTHVVNGEPIAMTNVSRGSKHYIAPELKNVKTFSYSPMTDIYAAGCTLFLILFDAYFDNLAALIAGKEKINYATCKFKNKNLADIVFRNIQKLVDPNAKNRPSSSSIIQCFRELRDQHMSLFQKVKTFGLLDDEFVNFTVQQKQSYIKLLQLMDEVAILDNQSRSERDLMLLQEFFSTNKIFAKQRFIAKANLNTLEKVIRFDREFSSQHICCFFVSCNAKLLQEVAKTSVNLTPFELAPAHNEFNSSIASQYNLFETDYKLEFARINDTNVQKPNLASHYTHALTHILMELMTETKCLYDQRQLTHCQLLVLLKKTHHLLTRLEKSANTTFDTTALLKKHIESMLPDRLLSDSLLVNMSIQ